MARSIVRLKDIAERTGFSVNTVSLALRQSPRIPEDTRVVIQQAAETLNYAPNHVAKSLVSRQTMTIGLVLTEITNPMLTHVAQAIELALAERGYSTLFATSNNDSATEKKVIEMFRSRQVDGMLIYPRNHRDLDHIKRLRQDNYPVVLLVADVDAGVDAVCMDERLGAYRATRHLIDVGHQRIGIIDGAKPSGNFEKREGYGRALAEAGLSTDDCLVADPMGNAVIRGYWAMDRLMNAANPPTAIIAACDSLAMGALRWTQKNSFRVPQDVAIMGFDNIEFAEHAATPISSVNYAVQMVTEQAVERLIGLIGAGDVLPEPRVTMIEPDLVIRDSTNGGRG